MSQQSASLVFTFPGRTTNVMRRDGYVSSIASIPGIHLSNQVQYWQKKPQESSLTMNGLLWFHLFFLTPEISACVVSDQELAWYRHHNIFRPLNQHFRNAEVEIQLCVVGPSVEVAYPVFSSAKQEQDHPPASVCRLVRGHTDKRGVLWVKQEAWVWCTSAFSSGCPTGQKTGEKGKYPAEGELQE